MLATPRLLCERDEYESEHEHKHDKKVGHRRRHQQKVDLADHAHANHRMNEIEHSVHELHRQMDEMRHDVMELHATLKDVVAHLKKDQGD